MPLSVLLPVLLLLVFLIGGFWWYRRALRRLEPDSDQREISGARLTSERLHQLAAPPWRVVFEIGRDRLPDVDHVVIGPAGVIAVDTVMSDRPSADTEADPWVKASEATLRSNVDELLAPVGMGCQLLAKVFWGTPDAGLPAAVERSPGTVLVEGQRLIDWLISLPPGGLTAAQVDLAWQAVTTGIGRPDPIS